jgi:hypothetical protein
MHALITTKTGKEIRVDEVLSVAAVPVDNDSSLVIGISQHHVTVQMGYYTLTLPMDVFLRAIMKDYTT